VYRRSFIRQLWRIFNDFGENDIISTIILYVLLFVQVMAFFNVSGRSWVDVEPGIHSVKVLQLRSKDVVPYGFVKSRSSDIRYRACNLHLPL